MHTDPIARNDALVSFGFLSENGFSAPVIVGGTGGSGTRFFTQLLRSLGVQMGSHCNVEEDALSFVDLYSAFINPFLTGCLPVTVLDQNLEQALRLHCSTLDPTFPWGWKNPRSIFLWPALATLLPGSRFIHVVRDGITMATSNNQNQLRQHGRVILGDKIEHFSEEAQSLLLWSRVNAFAADLGHELGNRYICLRFEDALADPESTQSQLAEFLSVPDKATAHFSVTASRPREISLENFPLDVRNEASTTLRRFGYALD